jgi:hypothetical protein
MKKPIKPLAAIALTAPLAGCGADNQEKPNIILFLIDDMGWLDTSVSFGEEVYPYNIRQDITERNDLSDSNPEKLQEMADALSAKLKGYNALMPTFRSTGDIVPMPDELAGRTAICPSDIQPTSQGH